MNRGVQIVLWVMAAGGALASDRAPLSPRSPPRQKPYDQTVIYARVQHGPGVTQYLPVSGNPAGTFAPVYSNGEITQIRSFGKNGEQIIYTVSPGQEGRFLYTRSLGPNGTLVYEPASLNPKPKQKEAATVAPDAPAPVPQPQPSQIPTNYFPDAKPQPGGKPPPSVTTEGRLAREWADVFSSLTDKAEDGK